MHVIAAKAVSFKEALEEEFKVYQENVQANAAALAESFNEMGYNLVSGGTDNHLILIDLRNKGLTGKKAEQTLEKAGITLNKNMVPFDTESPFVTSGIRIGTPAMTTRGFTQDTFKEVAHLIDDLLSAPDDKNAFETVERHVIELCEEFPLYDFVTA
jgi:glycine hydroxymethyltransferase